MPVPSNAWFPTALADRAAWYQNFTIKFAQLAPQLGFDPGEVTLVEADNTLIQWLLQVTGEVDTFDKGVSTYRKLMLESPIGTNGITAPPVFAYPTPLPTADAGVFARLISLVDRIRVSGNYNEEDGELLGIVPSKPADLKPNELQPNPSLTALPGNVVEVAFTRGKTEGIDVEIDVDNSNSWEHAGKFFKSPGEIVIPQNTQATSRLVKLRARYLLDNKPVGLYSETDQISTIP